MAKDQPANHDELWRMTTRPLYYTHLTPQEIEERLRDGSD